MKTRAGPRDAESGRQSPPADVSSQLRLLPSVDLLLNTPKAAQLIGIYGRSLTLQAIRETLDNLRANLTPHTPVPGHDYLLEASEARLQEWASPPLVQVINATGVILHTNLGRAPLSAAALQAVDRAARGYSNLEYDLEMGKRGSRNVHLKDLFFRLTGAEAALVVNNNAAAVLLILSALARRRGALIARSQLVEIGGGFRIPDVMKQSGAHLVEVGTTNRVHRSDYETALQEGKAALTLRVHRSNFQIVGFTSEPTLQEIVEISHREGIAVVDDLGSGTVLDTAQFGLGHEPMVQESLSAGADLVCFSGDKLLGGPQAGIILGRKDLVTRLQKHPLARALRADKLCLAGLAATLLHYLRDEATSQIPVWRMISASSEDLRHRAAAWQADLGKGQVIAGESTVGGGSLPGEILPTFLLALDVGRPNRALAHLRAAQPPIIARLQDNRLVLDPRTVLPELDSALLAALRQLDSAL